MYYFDFFNEHIKGLRVTNKATGECKGICPFHDDHKPSFCCNVGSGLYFCHACGAKGNIETFKAKLGIGSEPSFGKEVAHYNYCDEEGKILFQKRRYNPKSFMQFRWEDGCWKPGLNEIRTVPYRLNEILNEPEVFIVEGEKDADNLWNLHIPASTSPNGAGGWPNYFSDYFKSKRVTIIPDQDAAGRKYAEMVTRSLWDKAESIRILDLPQGKDVTEWLELGGKPETLLELIEKTPSLTAPPALVDSSPNISASPNRLKLKTIKELLAQPKLEVNWIVEELLTAGGVSLLAAKPKTGKSTLARQLALCVARGIDFLGRPTTPGLVIYLALEEREADVRDHFEMMGVSPDDRIMICAAPVPDMISAFRATMEDKRPVLIFVDTLARLARIKDFNNYGETTAALEPILAIAREINAHICLIHHGNKKGGQDLDSVLGSTSLTGTADTIIILSRKDEHRVISSIQRVGVEISESILLFDSDSRWSTLGESTDSYEVSSFKEEILAYLQCLKKQVTEPGILQGVQGKSYFKKKALRALVADGLVERYGAGKRNQPYFYAVNARSQGPGDSMGPRDLPSEIHDQKTRADKPMDPELQRALAMWVRNRSEKKSV